MHITYKEKNPKCKSLKSEVMSCISKWRSLLSPEEASSFREDIAIHIYRTAYMAGYNAALNDASSCKCNRQAERSLNCSVSSKSL